MEGSLLWSASPRQGGCGHSSWQQMGTVLLDCPGQSFGEVSSWWVFVAAWL